MPHWAPPSPIRHLTFITDRISEVILPLRLLVKRFRYTAKVGSQLRTELAVFDGSFVDDGRWVQIVYPHGKILAENQKLDPMRLAIIDCKKKCHQSLSY